MSGSDSDEFMYERMRKVVAKYPELIELSQGNRLSFSSQAYSKLSGREMDSLLRTVNNEFGMHVMHSGNAISVLMNELQDLKKRVDDLEKHH